MCLPNHGEIFRTHIITMCETTFARNSHAGLGRPVRCGGMRVGGGEQHVRAMPGDAVLLARVPARGLEANPDFIFCSTFPNLRLGGIKFLPNGMAVGTKDEIRVLEALFKGVSASNLGHEPLKRAYRIRISSTSKIFVWGAYNWAWLFLANIVSHMAGIHALLTRWTHHDSITV